MSLSPAVSNSLNFISAPFFETASMSSLTLSRVVPATWLTIMRSSPSIRFAMELLPTFGLPATEILILPSPPSGAGSILPKRASSISMSASIPQPCSAETSATSANPREKNSELLAACEGTSTLLTARITSLPAERRRAAISSSSGVRPSCESTTNTTVSAVSIANFACKLVARAITFSPPEAEANMPPVSISATPSERGSATMSRVTPGLSCTIETRRPRMRLKSRLLPTFGRPTRATLFSTGALIIFPYFSFATAFSILSAASTRFS